MRYKTVRDIPDTYVLLTGDEAREYTPTGCAFVLVGNAEILDVYVTESAVPWIDAHVKARVENDD